nr:hypothetical protein CFP56_27405 [Quercus suber]
MGFEEPVDSLEVNTHTIKEPNPNQTDKPCRLQNKKHIQCFHLYDDLPTTRNSFINFICLTRKKRNTFKVAPWETLCICLLPFDTNIIRTFFLVAIREEWGNLWQ